MQVVLRFAARTAKLPIGTKKSRSFAWICLGAGIWIALVPLLQKKKWIPSGWKGSPFSTSGRDADWFRGSGRELTSFEARQALYSSATALTGPSTSTSWNVCRFQGVCVNLTDILFVIRADMNTIRSLDQDLKDCCWKEEPCSEFRALCQCLHKHGGPHAYRGWRVGVSKANELQEYVEGNSWLLNTKVTRTHPWHFAMKVVQLSSILTRAKDLGLPLPTTVAFQDYPSEDMTDWDRRVWKISAGVWDHSQVNLFTVGMRKPTCFQSLHFTSEYDTFFKRKQEVSTWRASMLEEMGENLCGTKSLECFRSWCAQPMIGILHRVEGLTVRNITNMEEVENALSERFKLPIEHFNVSSLDSPTVQAQRFVKYQVIFSAHSSQLANLLYAHPAAVIIEVCVDCDRVFYTMGTSLGLFYVRSRLHMAASEADVPKNSNVKVNISKLVEDIGPAAEYLRVACTVPSSRSADHLDLGQVSSHES